MHYALDFQLAQIAENPAANAVLEKYLPKTMLQSRMTVFPLSMAASFAHVSPDTMQAMEAELTKIPVE
jgi:hypothetical protein